MQNQMFTTQKSTPPSCVQKYRAWQEEVRDFYPDQGKDLRFRAYIEGAEILVCAEVFGVDRCFGIFDMNGQIGIILGD